MRVDSTVTETHILAPADSRLLYDGVRVLTRLLGEVRQQLGADAVPFHDHRRAAKRRHLEARAQRGRERRAQTYRRLLRLARRTLRYVDGTLPAVATTPAPWAQRWTRDVRHYADLLRRPIQKSRVVSSGIETAGIERIGSTRRGVLTTPWHAEDGPLMSGECYGGVPIRVFPPDGGPRASGCHGAAERRTASLEDGSFRAVRRSGWRRGRPVGGRRSGDWPGGCTGTRRARAQWRWRRCSTPPDCAAGSAPRRGSDPRRS